MNAARLTSSARESLDGSSELAYAAVPEASRREMCAHTSTR